jgi:hypothetical protein
MKARGLRAGRWAAAAAGLFLAGCILTGGDSFFLSHGGGGGEDFPNTAQPLAKELAKEAASSTEWGQVASLQLPELPDLNVFGTLSIEPIGLSKGLAKRGLAKRSAEGECDTTYYEYSESEILVSHRGRQIVCDEDSLRVRRDTLQFWLRTLPTGGDSATIAQLIQDSAVLIQAWGTLTYKLESRVQAYRAWNTDSVGTLDHAEYVTTTTGSAKTVQRVRLYGRDGAYQRDGAPPGYYELLKTVGRDTLDWQRMTDADGDSAFWDRTSKEGSKGVVDFERRAKDPAESPATARLSQKMRALLHHEPGKNDSMVTRWYFDQRTLKSGATTLFSYRGVKPDSSLNANDTALIALDTVFAVSDSMIRYRADYRMLLGADPSDAAGRSLLGFAVDKSWRRGKLRGSSTQFFPTSPLPTGQPFAGRMAAQTHNKDGDTVYTDGTINADGMVLTMRVVSDGKTTVYRLVLDLEGNEKEPMVEITQALGGDTSGRDTSRVIEAPARTDSTGADSVKTTSPSRSP